MTQDLLQVREEDVVRREVAACLLSLCEGGRRRMCACSPGSAN